MSKTASFGRRSGAASRPAPPPKAGNVREEVALTPEQRALLFDAPAARDSGATAPAAPPTHVRNAATVATFATAAVVIALAFQMPRGGNALAPLALVESLLSISSNLALSLWLTRLLCRRRNWSGMPAFFLAGAAISGGLAIVTAAIGLGGDIAPATAAAAGGGAAALYRLIAGGARLAGSSERGSDSV